MRYEIYDLLHRNKQGIAVMYGDSITENGKWHRLLRKNNIINQGTAGHTSTHLLSNAANKVQAHKPVYCFIMVGTNDISVGIPPERTIKNVQRLVEYLQHENIQPVLQSVLYASHNHPGFNNQADSLNNAFQKLAAEYQTDYLNINQFLSENRRLKKEYAMDNVHINKKAYDVWFNEITEYLKKLKAES